MQILEYFSMRLLFKSPHKGENPTSPEGQKKMIPLSYSPAIYQTTFRTSPMPRQTVEIY